MRAGMLLATAALLIAAPSWAEEQPVNPYLQADANAGAAPITGDAVYRALHGKDGIDRIVADLIHMLKTDPRTADVFAASDIERLQRTLSEDVCFVSGGPCHYTGMDMKTAHQHMGLQEYHFNALVEMLEDAMTREGVPFRYQAKLLAKFAPMKPQVVDASQN
jgi:hemoglobin